MPGEPLNAEPGEVALRLTPTHGTEHLSRRERGAQQVGGMGWQEPRSLGERQWLERKPVVVPVTLSGVWVSLAIAGFWGHTCWGWEN